MLQSMLEKLPGHSTTKVAAHGRILSTEVIWPHKIEKHRTIYTIAIAIAIAIALIVILIIANKH